MKKIIFFLFLALSIGPQVFGQNEACCNDFTLYGDEVENTPTRIKHFEDFTYLTSHTSINDETFAVFSKFDHRNELVWDFRLDFQSQLFDFVKTDDGGFLIVGRTLPAQSNNKSLLLKIRDDGSTEFFRIFDYNAREGFFRIVKHDHPDYSAAPYFITSFRNPFDIVSFDDKVHLHNLDEQGNINWSTQFSFLADDQFARGILPLTDGSLLLMGDAFSSGISPTGILVKVSGVDGSIITSHQATDNVIFREGVELDNGNIVIAGQINTPTPVGLLTLVDSNLNFISATKLENNGIQYFPEIKRDKEEHLFFAGNRSNELPVIFKARVDNDQIVISDSKYAASGETDFTAPVIDLVGAKFYYADGRTDHSSSFGAADIFLGYFNTQLSDNCLKDISIDNQTSTFSFNSITVSKNNFIESLPLSGQAFQSTLFDFESLCATKVSTNDNPSLDLNINISPNPTPNLCLINSDKPLKSVDLFNTLGQKILHVNFTAVVLQHTVPLGNLPSGNYFLKVDNGTISTHKIIKE